MTELPVQSSLTSLDKIDARRIIQNVGESGQPPIYGYQFFTAGIDPYINIIKEEYLEEYISNGGSSFKLVIGTYGGGKTHFLYSIQGSSWNNQYITAYIELSQNETPFHKLEEVYKAIVSNLVYPQDPKALILGYDKGIEALIKIWYYMQTQNVDTHLSLDEKHEYLSEYIKSIGPYESTSFQNAIRHAFLALMRDNEEQFHLILQWLKGENPPKSALKEFNIYEKIDKTTAFKMIRCLIKWIQDLQYNGLIVLMDEAEQTPSMSTKQRETLLNNLREVIDACSKGSIKSTMFFYAVPDTSFLEGRATVYEALNQRLSTIFSGQMNPTGVRINLDDLIQDPLELLHEIGLKLARIYEIAYDFQFNQSKLEDVIQTIAQEAYDDRYGEISYKRSFVQNIIGGFHKMKNPA